MVPHLLAGLVERRDRAADRDPAVAGDLGGHPADPADVGLPVLLGEGQPGRQVPAYDVAVEAGHGAVALLEQPVLQRAGERGLAAAGEAGEEEHQARWRSGGGRSASTIAATSSGRSPSSSSASASTGSPAGVVAHDLDAELVVGVGVAVGGQRDGHHLGVGQVAGRGQGGADQADGAEPLGGAGAGEREQDDRLLAPGQARRAAPSVSGSVTGTNVAAGVPLADLGAG